MRTQRQQPAGFGQQSGSSMVDEFFGQERQVSHGPAASSPFEFNELHRELDAVRLQRGNWANEFQQSGPKLWELTPGEEEAMEKAFLESKAAAGPSQSVSGTNF